MGGTFSGPEPGSTRVPAAQRSRNAFSSMAVHNSWPTLLLSGPRHGRALRQQGCIGNSAEPCSKGGLPSKRALTTVALSIAMGVWRKPRHRAHQRFLKQQGTHRASMSFKRTDEATRTVTRSHPAPPYSASTSGVEAQGFSCTATGRAASRTYARQSVGALICATLISGYLLHTGTERPTLRAASSACLSKAALSSAAGGAFTTTLPSSLA